ncbi:MAG: AMP-binding protein, partial [Candidatus Kapaibacterium sp.]
FVRAGFVRAGFVRAGFKPAPTTTTTTTTPTATAPDDPALVTMTTGSTGTPKGARRTHRFLVAQHDALVRSLGSSAEDIDMPLLPVFVLSNLALGATTVIPPVDPRNVESFDPSAVVDVIRRAGVTTTSGSPVFYDLLARYCVERNVALPTLRALALGGAPVFPPLAASLVAAFPNVEITIVYGSTEAEPISTITAGELLRDSALPRRGLPVGTPTPDIEVLILPIREELLAENRAELERLRLPAEEIGEICVAGEHVLKEYYGDPEVWRKNKIFVGDEVWHRTGDAGYLDAGGKLYLAGRVRQSFIHGGERIFVFPIEERLLEMEGVAAGTIIQLGERLVVVVEPAPGRKLTVAEIEMMMAKAGIPYDTVMSFRAIPRDPRHRSKIDYDRLRELVEKR